MNDGAVTKYLSPKTEKSSSEKKGLENHITTELMIINHVKTN